MDEGAKARGFPELPRISSSNSEKVFRHKSLTAGGVVPDGVDPVSPRSYRSP